MIFFFPVEKNFFFDQCNFKIKFPLVEGEEGEPKAQTTQKTKTKKNPKKQYGSSVFILNFIILQNKTIVVEIQFWFVQYTAFSFGNSWKCLLRLNYSPVTRKLQKVKRNTMNKLTSLNSEFLKFL